MSFWGLGPIIFGGNDKIIDFLRTNNLLARSTRYIEKKVSL